MEDKTNEFINSHDENYNKMMEACKIDLDKVGEQYINLSTTCLSRR